MSAQRTAFIETLLRDGFSEGPDSIDGFRMVGEVSFVKPGGEESDEFVEVSVTADFPYSRPQVKTTTGVAGNSWHRLLDQTLCLWADDGSVTNLPWTDGTAFLERVRRWLSMASNEWSDDVPVPDLERYYPPLSGTAFTFDRDDIDFRRNRWFKCSSSRVGDLRVVKMCDYVNRPLVASGRNQRRGLYGFAADVGELTRPPSSWYEFADRIDAGHVKHLEHMVAMHGRVVALLRYTIFDVPGETPLLLKKKSGQAIEIAGSLTPIPSGDKIRTMRGGPTFPQLRDKSVAVVGVGAVGSYVADLLVRGGVGHLSLYDPDILRPGNGIRHLAADANYELQPKTEAVRTILSEYGFVNDSDIDSNVSSITSVDEVELLVDSHDLIIDATASGGTSVLLADAATGDTSVVQVVLQRNGGVVRVDTFPNEGHREEIPNRESQGEVLRESGCSDPVSPTPPSAVVQAAAITADIARDILVGSPFVEPTRLVVLAVQPDEPLDRLGPVL